jgi:hypothetical protein
VADTLIRQPSRAPAAEQNPLQHGRGTSVMSLSRYTEMKRSDTARVTRMSALGTINATSAGAAGVAREFGLPREPRRRAWNGRSAPFKRESHRASPYCCRSDLFGRALGSGPGAGRLG